MQAVCAQNGGQFTLYDVHKLSISPNDRLEITEDTANRGTKYTLVRGDIDYVEGR